METTAVDLRSIFLHRTNLLMFESPRDHQLLDDAIRDHIAPSNLLEEIWSSEIREVEWELRRLQRFKRQIVNSAKPRAFRSLLESITDGVDPEGIDELAQNWPSQRTAKKKVAAMLSAAGLDELAIDAEAYRISLTEIVLIDRRLAELAERRDELFQQIEDHRAATATPVRSHKSKAVIEHLDPKHGGEI